MKHRRFCWLTLAALLSLSLPAQAWADTLSGDAHDALTATPIAGATVRVLGTNLSTQTDAQGQWSLELPQGRYQLEIQAQVGPEAYTAKLVNQYVPQIKPARFRIYSGFHHSTGAPLSSAHPFGAPAHSGQAPAGAPESLEIPGSVASPIHLGIPAVVPRRIRVGRRQRPEQGCRNNPIIAIEEMDIDEYVKGVLPPEIGVFRSIPGSSEVYKAFAIAAKSYGLFFMLNYDANNRRTTTAKPPNNYTWFHIDDTACNQRYADDRLSVTTDAATSVANKIMVKRGEPNVLDKLEYAASCGKHGTQPEYNTKSQLVPDNAPQSPCVGSWCGHNTCAGHEDNPALAGSDRCLVRGVCQWGAASWGASSKDYLWMIDHYQPNLEIRDLSAMEDPKVQLTGYAFTNDDDILGSGVGGASITLSDGQTTSTDSQGVYLFDEVLFSLGTVTVSANAPGYRMATKDKMLEEGVTNWASLKLVPTQTQPGQDMSADMVEDDTSDVLEDARADESTPRADATLDQDEDADADQPSPGGPGALDNLVNPSPGLEGCCAQLPSQAPAGHMGALALLSALVLGWRRRRDT